MKAKDLKNMQDAELQAKLADLKTEYFNLRFQKATGQLANPVYLGQVKKDIARVKTIMRERELAANAE